MKCSKYPVAACLVAGLTLAAACGDITLSPLAGGLIARRISGTVTDDAGALPTGSPARLPTPIAGARVEVVAGPEKGHFAISAANGRYDLGLISAGSRLRATLAGWELEEYPVYITGPSTVVFTLGRAPHVLWGNVYVTGTLQPIAGVRVEILTGSNAGTAVMTSETGLYRFDGLATEGRVDFEFSKAGYRSERSFVSEMQRNTERGWTLTPSGER